MTNLIKRRLNEKDLTVIFLRYYYKFAHLNFSCKFDDIKNVELLIDRDEIDINITIDGNYENTPLHLSCMKNNGEIIDLVLKKSSIEIKKLSFQKCRKLTKISLPQFLIEIENSMFECCNSLVYVFVPSSVTKISSNSFKFCTSLID